MTTFVILLGNEKEKSRNGEILEKMYVPLSQSKHLHRFHLRRQYQHWKSLQQWKFFPICQGENYTNINSRSLKIKVESIHKELEENLEINEMRKEQYFHVLITKGHWYNGVFTK